MTLDERQVEALESIALSLVRLSKRKVKPRVLEAKDEAPAEAWDMASLVRRLLLALDSQHTVGGKRYNAKQHAQAWHIFQSEGAAKPISWDLIERVMRYHLSPTGNTYWHTRLGTVSRIGLVWMTLVGQMEGGRRANERTTVTGVSDDDRAAARRLTFGGR